MKNKLKDSPKKIAIVTGCLCLIGIVAAITPSSHTPDWQESELWVYITGSVCLVSSVYVLLTKRKQ